MKILFDQGTPVPLRAHIKEHTVNTAYEMEWSHLKNSILLQTAEDAGYDLLVTTDQNLKYQQNLQGRKLSILVLLSTSWPRIKEHVNEIIEMINSMQSGDYKELAI